jgi:transposase
MLNATDLPDDIEALKAMLLARDAALLASEAKVAHLSAELSTRTAEIEHLKLVLTKLKRMQFGRRSEKLDQQIEQLELQLEDLEAEAAVAEAQAPVDVAPRKKAERKPLPPHLPREERVQMPVSDACPECGGTLKRLGESVSEQLEYVPASFRVIRHVRPKLACGCCDAIVQAPAASRPIERGLAGPGLLAHVLVAKFADHIPLYRQSTMYAREGVDLERALLASWVGAAGTLLRPWSTHCAATYSPPPSCTPTTRRCRCWRPVTARRALRVSGPMCAMTVAVAMAPRRPCGLPIRPTAKASTRRPTWPTSAASCRLTRMPASTLSMKAAKCWKPLAGPMPVASFMTSTQHAHRP